MKLISLLEALKLTPSNVKAQAGTSLETLTKLQDFIDIQHLDPSFASKLKVAWEGDLKEAGRDKLDFLFDKMLAPAIVAKLSKLDASKFGQSLKLLTDLHHFSMALLRKKPPTKTNQDKSVWGHVEWARESYDALIGEVTLLLESRDEDFGNIDGWEAAIKETWPEAVLTQVHTVTSHVWSATVGAKKVSRKFEGGRLVGQWDIKANKGYIET